MISLIFHNLVNKTTLNLGCISKNYKVADRGKNYYIKKSFVGRAKNELKEDVDSKSSDMFTNSLKNKSNVTAFSVLEV